MYCKLQETYSDVIIHRQLHEHYLEIPFFLASENKKILPFIIFLPKPNYISHLTKMMNEMQFRLN